METEFFIDLVTNIGFPIACVIALFIQNDTMRKQQLEDNEKFRSIIDSNTNAVTRLSQAISSLIQLVGKGDD